MTVGEGQLSGSSFRTHEETRAFGYIVFAGGRPSDAQIFTINGRIYELDTNGAAATGGQVLVDITGNATVDDDITDMAVAINNDAGQSSFKAYADTANDILWIYATAYGTAGNAITLTEGLSNATASGATLAEGRVGGPERREVIRHVISSAEATAGVIRLFAPGMRQVLAFEIRLEDGGVVDDTIDTAVAVTQPNILIVTEGSGPAWAAGDVLVIEVVGIQ
jgi:hypothetical protein